LWAGEGKFLIDLTFGVRFTPGDNNIRGEAGNGHSRQFGGIRFVGRVAGRFGIGRAFWKSGQ